METKSLHEHRGGGRKVNKNDASYFKHKSLAASKRRKIIARVLRVVMIVLTVLMIVAVLFVYKG